MQLIIAYISVVLIWATTPLTIQWSSESVGYLFGISSRIVLAAVMAVLIIGLMGKSLALHRKAIETYIAAGLGLVTAMLSVYWSAGYIPSGWISTIYGITPIITGLLAMKILGESSLTMSRIFAIGLGIIGLCIMFNTGLEYGPKTAYGIIGVITSSFFYSLSIVAMKKIDADIDTYSTVTGSLLVAASLFAIIWIGFGEALPTNIPYRAGMSILYLATIGSLLGFFLFYYVLKRVDATRASLITLMTPICSLMLGHYINNEPLTIEIITGCAIILSGLILYEFEGAIRRIRTVNQ